MMILCRLLKLLKLVIQLFYIHTCILYWLIESILFPVYEFSFEILYAAKVFLVDLYQGIGQFVQTVISIPKAALYIVVIIKDNILATIQNLDHLIEEYFSIPNPYQLISIFTLIGLVVPISFLARKCLKLFYKFLRICFIEQRPIYGPDDDLCSMCLDHVLRKEHWADRQFATLEQCLHTFCVKCIQAWKRQRHNDCPLCRQVSYRARIHSRLMTNVEAKKRLFAPNEHTLCM